MKLDLFTVIDIHNFPLSRLLCLINQGYVGYCVCGYWFIWLMIRLKCVISIVLSRITKCYSKNNYGFQTGYPNTPIHSCEHEIQAHKGLLGTPY